MAATTSARRWPGYDYLMQAEAGIMGLTGEPDGPPTRVGASMVDFMTGATGATGLLACILRAQRSGTGCDVDTCLFDVALHQLSYAAVWYLNEGDAARAHAAQRAPLGRAGPDLPDRGRLDLHHVHDRQVLEQPDRHARPGRPCERRRASPRRPRAGRTATR